MGSLFQQHFWTNAMQTVFECINSPAASSDELLCSPDTRDLPARTGIHCNNSLFVTKITAASVCLHRGSGGRPLQTRSAETKGHRCEQHRAAPAVHPEELEVPPFLRQLSGPRRGHSLALGRFTFRSAHAEKNI